MNFPKPELLSSPNIPKPLHGVNPRTIFGKEWWDRIRQLAYMSTNYRCIACGVEKRNAKYHRWLEAHESYTVDYENGIVKVYSIVPLCHSCHNFIHSGRLWKLFLQGEITEYKIKDILEHGMRILRDNHLRCFWGTKMIAEELDIQSVEAIEPETCYVEWEDWRLEFDGKKYAPKFKDMAEWKSFYSRK